MPWLKWTDGETKRVKIISTEPFQKVIHWVGGRSMDCHGSLCQMCKLGDRSAVRWSVETVTDGEGMTWEMANMVWKDLAVIAENQKGLAGVVLDVIRKGMARETRYTLILVGKEDVAVPAPASGELGGGGAAYPPSYDEQLRAGTLPPVPGGDRGQEAADRVRRDAGGAAVYCKGLCERLGEDARVALGIFLGEAGKAYAKVEATAQLAAFITHQETRLEAEELEAAKEKVEVDLDKLLA